MFLRRSPTFLKHVQAINLLAPGEVRLELDLAPGAKVAAALLKFLGANADQRIVEAEARTFA